MPYKEKPIEKLYYSISEVADLLDVNTSLIRFWESEFDLLKPKKNRKGDRVFTKSDIEDLKLVYHLVKEKGYTLKGAQQQIKAERSRVEERVKTLEILRSIRGYLTDLKKEL